MQKPSSVRGFGDRWIVDREVDVELAKCISGVMLFGSRTKSML